MRISAAELGADLARLVWESYSDFMERRGISVEEDGDDSTVITLPTIEPVEALIFFMWLHTRACQQAFTAQLAEARATLDTMHQQLYRDLEERAIPKVQLPLFEQRVSARYSEYYDAAAASSERRVVDVAAGHVLIEGMKRPGIALDLAEAATVTSGPLRDFLEDVEFEAQN